MYKTTSDVSQNSPGDWDRILKDANAYIVNSANDRYINYDTSQGIDGPITELNSPWVLNPSWPDRVEFIDDKEPRPGINGKDYAALSVLNAAFVYLVSGGDHNDIGNHKGKDYAAAVKKELLWYANNEWLDFSNTKRWIPSSNGGFNDRNPGFFIACWLNSMLNAYDYTRSSSVYSQSDRQTIDTWLYNGMVFYHSLMYSVMKSPFISYDQGDYSNVSTGGWNDHLRGKAWDGSEYSSYGLNEFFANRSTVNWRFAARTALFLKDHNQYGNKAKEIIHDAHRWFKDWVIYGTFEDGTHIDFHRSNTTDPQRGLQYSTIAIGAMVDIADAYERVMNTDPSFESLYAWEITSGTAEYQKYFPAETQGRPWRESIEFSGTKSFKTVINTLLKYFDGSFGSIRAWDQYPIDGHSYPSDDTFVKIVESDRWIALANTYYKDMNWKSIYTRTKSGTFPYVSNPTKAGSYDINMGAWGSHPGTLFMFGQMEGEVWPYAAEIPLSDLIEAEDNFQVLDNTGDFGDVGQVGHTASLLSNKKGVKIFDRGDAFRLPFAIDQKGLYRLNLRARVGDAAGIESYLPNGYVLKLDDSSIVWDTVNDISASDNSFGETYWGTLQIKEIELESGSHYLDIESYRNWGIVDYLKIEPVIITPANLIFEAEEVYEVVSDTGNNAYPSISETSELLNNKKGLIRFVIKKFV
ncbi:hypothetical protein [Aquimarina sp. RZ0]|uniref:hypothetical protein n=1 Tax=Aquimarina sp. RZ0 TaxID=2607730 RepID=UPI0011F19E0A|nr:hypothetical protein [Aquimarina sp. RZ0]KAA1246014.1 hypothetical protein F0000_09885 [Aquimarina sp. RZ0]